MLNCYTKLTQSSTEMWNLQVFNPHENIIIHNNLFYQREQKPNSIRQSFAHQTFWNASFVKFRQTSTVKVLRYTVLGFCISINSYMCPVESKWMINIRLIIRNRHIVGLVCKVLICTNSVKCCGAVGSQNLIPVTLIYLYFIPVIAVCVTALCLVIWLTFVSTSMYFKRVYILILLCCSAWSQRLSYTTCSTSPM